jgi:D-alanine-D-alanine ligase
MQRLGRPSRLLKIDTLDDLVPVLRGVDVVFNCLHGGSGEDGTVQLLLQVLGIPSIGSGPLACARAMDKAQAKAIFRSKDLPTPDGVSVTAESLDEGLQEASTKMRFPLILKPQSGGSTISVYRANSVADLRSAAQAVLEHAETVLIEPFIAGRELTVGVLLIEGEETALPIIEIQFTRDLFDYEAKYTEGNAIFLAPAPLPDDIAERVQSVALQAHQSLGCYGFSRVDIRLGNDGVPYLLEVNTLPGMTPMSDLPRAAAVLGIGYDELVARMLATATPASLSGALNAGFG